MVNKDGWHQIPLGGLTAILEVLDDGTGTGGKTVRVEPGATVSEVTHYLSSQGLMLDCTLEMEDATLGGLAAATGMTSHSHVCGLIHDTITAYEVVLPSGEVAMVTEDGPHAHLFNVLPWSHGALGFLVGVTLRCVPSAPYVKLSYRPFKTMAAFAEAYQQRLAEAHRGDAGVPWFIEGIAYTKDHAVLVEGRLCHSPTESGAAMNNMGLWHKPWYFKHVERALNDAGGLADETVPMYDYLMRHDRSMCMTMPYILPFGNDAWFRWCFGWLLPPYMALLKGSHTDETREASARKQVYQDLGFPADKFEEMVAFCDDTFAIYPLLVYPCQVADVPGRMVRCTPCTDGPTKTATSSPLSTLASAPSSAMYMNLGLYGVPRDILDHKPFKTVTKVRALEQRLREIGGFQHTYCDSFQKRGEFEAMFDMRTHNAKRAELGADGALVDVYTKTRPEVDVFAWLEAEASM